MGSLGPVEWSKQDCIRMLRASRVLPSAMNRTDSPRNLRQQQNTVDLSGSKHLPPLLRLPSKILQQIFRYIIEPELCVYGDGIHVIELNDFQHNQPSPTLKPNFLNIFLINNQLHSEAEQALWQHYPVSLLAWTHYKYPLRQSPILNLSAYALANIRSLWIPFYVSRLNGFSAIKPGYNNIIGNIASSRSTWHYEKLARRLVNLQALSITISESKDMRREGGFRARCINAIIGMLDMFVADQINICCETEDTIFDLRMSSRYRIKDYETRCKFSLSESGSDRKEMDLDEALAPETTARGLAEGFPYQTPPTRKRTVPVVDTQVVTTVVTTGVKKQASEAKDVKAKATKAKASEAKGGAKAAESKGRVKSLEEKEKAGSKTAQSKGSFLDSLCGKLRV